MLDTKSAARGRPARCRPSVRSAFAVLLAGVVFGLAGCSTAPPAQSGGRGPRVSFEDAQARCGASVAMSDEVRRCMARQGWAYRHPWE